jgi:hypothetical protein
MNWLNLGALPWLLLLPALVALYMLRPRATRKPVSSLRLWQALPQVDHATRRVRLPPLSLLLVLQVVLLLAGLAALLRPALSAPPPRHLVLLLDASGSMQAADGPATRFAHATEEAGRLLGALGPDDRVTLVRVGAQVTTTCAGCERADAERALAGLRPGAGRADWAAALSVPLGLQGQSDPGAVDTVVLSDGAFAPLPPENLPTPLRFVAVGAPVDNRAITTLSARRPPDGSAGYTVYARVENDGSRAAQVSIGALNDTVPVPARQLTLPAAGHADLVWTVPAGTARFTVSLDGSDALAADDRALLFLPDSRGRTVPIRSAQPDLYARVLASLPGVVPLTGTVTNTLSTAFTLIEGQLPDPLPAGNLLLVNPSGPGLTSRGSATDMRAIPPTGNDPLLAGLDLGALLVRQGQQITPPPWLDTVVDSPAGPLVLAGERPESRVVMLTFDPRESNLPKLAAFPLLMANLVDWLDPLAGTATVAPGTAIRLPPEATVTPPDGPSAPVGAGGAFAATDTPGLYRVKNASGAEVLFAVNMTDAAESNLAPQAHPELTRPADEAMPPPVARQEIWWPLAALALLLLGGAWLTYCWKRGRA